MGDVPDAGSSRGKTSKKKREQIIHAFMQAVLELGLEKASMGEVAARTGLDRSSIHYYFRHRDELLSEAAQLVTQHYVDRLHAAVASFSAQDRARQLVEHLLGGAMHQPDLSQLIDELSVAGNRNKAINRLVAGIYRALEKVMLTEIDAAYPDAPAKKRREVGYVLSQLSEGCSVFTSLGFGADRLKAAHDIAMQLLDGLESAPVRP